jgi:hypothetical protein
MIEYHLCYLIALLGLILYSNPNNRKEGVVLMILASVGLIYLSVQNNPNPKLSYNNRLVLKINDESISESMSESEIENFITGKGNNTLNNCNNNKEWTIDFDKANSIKKMCPLYKNCEKRGNDIFCDGNKINNYDERLLECTQNYDLLNFIQSEWRNYCQSNSSHCLCLDLQNKSQKLNYITNLKKWIDNLTPGQLHAWKVYLIDRLKLKFKKRNYFQTETHEHKNIEELILHLKSIDENIYLVVKDNIGIDEESIKSIYEKLIKTRENSMNMNEDQSTDNIVRLNLTLQILESILDNYEQLVFDKNATFIPENKCKEVISPVSKGLVKDDLISITQLQGTCPKNHYLKGIRFEKDVSQNKPQLKKILSCCLTKKENDNDCENHDGSITQQLQRYDVREIHKLSGECPKYHYLKGVNYKKQITPIINNDVVSLIANNDKYLNFSPMIYNPQYEKICSKKKKWVLDRQTHKRCFNYFGSQYCYNYKHPHWKQVVNLECNDIFQGDFSTPESGKVETKNSINYETYINDEVKKLNREPLDTEKLSIEIKPDNKFAFKTSENYYLSADPNSHSSKIRQSDKITIKSQNKYLSSLDNGSISWNNDVVTDNEKFTFNNIDYKSVSIKNKDNKYLGVNKSSIIQSEDIYVGGSISNVKVVQLSQVGFEPNETPINEDYNRYNDRFDIKINKKELIIKRTDSGGGWGQRLKIRINLYEYTASFNSLIVTDAQKFNIYNNTEQKVFLRHKHLFLTRNENNAIFKVSTSVPYYGWNSKYFFFTQSYSVPSIQTLNGMNPNVQKVDEKLMFNSTPGSWSGLAPRTTHFATHHVTYLKATSDGSYIFKLRSDDGSKLFIDNTLVVNNDGLHGMRSRYGSKILVKDQTYKIEVTFFQRHGWAGLQVYFKSPGVFSYKPFVGTVEPMHNMSQQIEITSIDPPEVNESIITAHSDIIGEKQLFSLESLQEDEYAIIAFNGKYLSLNNDNSITFNATTVSDSEKFRILKKTELKQVNTCCKAIKNEQCSTIYGPYTQGLDKDNLLSLNKLDGRCPKNNYLKGIEIEKKDDELRFKMNCCRTDIPDNKNATWDQILNNSAPSYEPEPIESEVDELVRKELKSKFCHTHTYTKTDEKDILHFNKQPDKQCSINTNYIPDLTKNQNNDINDLEIFIESQNHYLSENIFLTKGQKLLFYMILLKVKNINHDIDYNKLFDFFKSNDSKSNKNINIFNI